jgi:cytochrome c1
MSLQSRIAGAQSNTPDHLVQWIVDPKAVKPDTTMPRTGISEQDARRVAAYLLSLQ